MRKQKFYFGKRKVNHIDGKIASQWAVPTLLREYFILRQRLRMMFFSMKIAMNSRVGLGTNTNATYGMMGGARKILTPAEAEVIPDESKDYYTGCMLHRRKIAKALDRRTTYSFQRLRAVFTDAKYFMDPQVQEATA
jgi:hypothetical protein